MKVCPNPVCPTMRRQGRAAEFLDHATACNDCGIALVASDAADAPETAAAVAAFHEASRAREEAAAEVDEGADERRARLDIATGIIAIVVSVALFVVPLAFVVWGGGRARVMFAIGPFVYGLFRLSRGLHARDPLKPDR